MVRMRYVALERAELKLRLKTNDSRWTENCRPPRHSMTRSAANYKLFKLDWMR